MFLCLTETGDLDFGGGGRVLLAFVTVSVCHVTHIYMFFFTV